MTTEPAGWSRAQRRLHWLTAALVLVPTLGLLTAATAPGGLPTLLFLLVPVPHPLAPDAASFALIRPLHIACALLLLSLAAAHALAALQHHQAGRPVLRAMWRG